MFEFEWSRKAQPRMEMDGGGSGGSGGSDAGAGGGGDPTPTPEPAPTPTERTAVNPLLRDDPAPAQQVPSPANPVVPETPPAFQPVELNFGGRVVTVSDPAILAQLQDVQKDYSSLNSTFTQKTQRLSELETQNRVLAEAAAARQQQQPPAPAVVEPTAAEAALSNPADFMDKFYENPQGTMADLVKSISESLIKEHLAPIQKVVQPIQEQNAVSQEIDQMKTQYADFDDTVPLMRQVLQDIPELSNFGMERVYQVAKARQQAAVPAAAPPTFEQMLADPANLAQLMGNEDIKKQFVTNYLAGVQQTQQGAPPIMGRGAGGQPPALPENRPQTLREGSKGFLASFYGRE